MTTYSLLQLEPDNSFKVLLSGLTKEDANATYWRFAGMLPAADCPYVVAPDSEAAQYVRGGRGS